MCVRDSWLGRYVVRTLSFFFCSGTFEELTNCHCRYIVCKSLKPGIHVVHEYMFHVNQEILRLRKEQNILDVLEVCRYIHVYMNVVIAALVHLSLFDNHLQCKL